MGMREWDGEKWVHKSGGIGSGGNGEPGADGYSPTATVEQTSDGAVITITDKKGTTTATVKNGKDGRSAYAYAKDGGYTGTEAEFAAKLAAEYPKKLPNPQALTINGQSYDGSKAVEVEVTGGSGIHIDPDAPTDENVDVWIDTDEDEDEGSTAQPDWNAAEGEAGHVLNRTHYSEWVTLFEETEIAVDPDVEMYFLPEFGGFEVRKTYMLTINGTSYEAVCGGLETGSFVGDLMYAETLDPTLPLPFVFIQEAPNEPVVGMYGDMSGAITMSLAVKRVEKLPAKYYPARIIDVLESDVSSNLGLRMVVLNNYDTTGMMDELLNGVPIYLRIKGEDRVKQFELTSWNMMTNFFDSMAPYGLVLYGTYGVEAIAESYQVQINTGS